MPPFAESSPISFKPLAGGSGSAALSLERQTFRVMSHSLLKPQVKVRITTYFQKGHGPPTRPAKMLIFKLTALESLVLLLNSPGHLRVRMTSAHQAGVLELIFKEKFRVLRVVKKKAAQAIGRIERFAENKKD